MSSALSVTFDDLESALQWVSSGMQFENSALISKSSGQVYYSSSRHDTEDELPEDIDDATLYWSVPHKNELELGRTLALRFTEEYLSAETGRVQGYFRQRGAYGRFKELLERTGYLEQWFEYEKQATKRALLTWASEEGLVITG